MTPSTEPYKSIMAFLATFVITLSATLQGRPNVDTMRVIDWVIVAIGSLAAAFAVYMVPNPPKGRRRQ